MRPGFLYQAGVAAYRQAVRAAAWWNPKARLAIKGREGWETRLRQQVSSLGQGKRCWIHCASLGEFEQGRPVIEAMKRAMPEVRIILTFFSPSGYEVRKNYAQADLVCYLPFDSTSDAARFIDIIRPDAAVFVKYELWLNYLCELRARKVPHYLISALVRDKSSYFTSPLKEDYRAAFSGFTRLLVQDEATANSLQRFTGRNDILVAGDTRYDRVAELAREAREVPIVASFISGRTCVIAGSAWPEDEAHIFAMLDKFPPDRLCWIIAPHEIHSERIDRLMRQFTGRMARYSVPEEIDPGKQVLWIDNIGMLNRLYRYGRLAYIGGGFGKGIHNTLEAAAYGTPVVFGPAYGRFEEAVELIREGHAISFNTTPEIENILGRILDGKSPFRPGAAEFVKARCGATEKVMAELTQVLA